MKHKPDMTVNIGSLLLKAPVLTASGTFGYGIEFKGLLDFNKIGGMVTKGISVNPRSGNPAPRIIETSSGMLNSIGLENPGLEIFINEHLKLIHELKTKIIVNIYGTCEKEYVELAERLSDLNMIDALELNVSCPNVSHGGIEFGQSTQILKKLTREVVEKSKLPVIVKLTPNVTSIVDMALAAVEGGCTAISLINTLRGMAIDINSKKPVFFKKFGGLSGPAIKPVAVAMVYQVASVVDVPVIGIGGIMSAKDAIEFFLAGAHAVQIGTASFINPRTAEEVSTGIEEYLVDNGCSSIHDIIGLAQQ